MSVTLNGEAILGVLANANELAKSSGEELAGAPDLAEFRTELQWLRQESTPKTYTAVAGVLLAARCMYEADDLDVLQIQVKGNPKGYSASSIGSKLAAFSKEQGIDLRARSTQPMNNQPFTFLPSFSSQTKAKDPDQWERFVALAQLINRMSSQEAERALALLFHSNRQIEARELSIHMERAGLAALLQVQGAIAQFVMGNSENGKVGQAFAAGLLDVVYGKEPVVLGDAQDPDASTPGDVHAKDARGIWLWVEVKQKVIQTGDVESFLEKVKANGGERVAYFALSNSSYSGQLKIEKILKTVDKHSMTLTVFESPLDALEFYCKVAPGSLTHVAEQLLERMRARLQEANVGSSLLAQFDEMASEYASVS